MSKDEKQDFINTLMTGLTLSLIGKINDMPENWDAWELRQLVKDEAALVVWGDSKNPARMRRYNKKRRERRI